MLLEQTLTVTPQEYSNLKNGGIALFYTPIPNHRKFIVLPQSHEPQAFTPQIFIEIVGRDLTTYLDELSLLELCQRALNMSPEQISYRRSLFENAIILFVRTYTFSTTEQLVLSHELGTSVLSYPWKVDKYLPLLPEKIFYQRLTNFRSGQPLQVDILEQMALNLTFLCLTDANAQNLRNRIVNFLTNSAESIPTIPDWIKERQLITLGDRSSEYDEGKSHYQAGTDFENITKKALEFLGFTIAEEHRGGAGGLDLYCSAPYPLVGECKAGKSIPSGTVEQLINLGNKNLGNERFMNSCKLIIGAGDPSTHVLNSAKDSATNISIIKPMSLQKLVELHAQYPNSINLIELRSYLTNGVCDAKIDEYVQVVKRRINTRSLIVSVVERLMNITGNDSIPVGTIYGAYMEKNPPEHLTEPELRDVLIELSSPIVGYLGRKEDRFYFLRHLPPCP
jgi:hypothetical protein